MSREKVLTINLSFPHTREELKNMSIIDIEDEFHSSYEG